MIYIIILLLTLVLWIFNVHKKYYILAVSPRIKTANSTCLERTVCTIPGTTIFGNNFDLRSMSPEFVYKFCRRNNQISRGKSYLLHFLFVAIYNVTNAEDAEDVLLSQTLITKGVIYDLIRPFLGTGLLTSTDQKWHKRRKTLTPAFHFNILQTFVEIFKEECLNLVKVLEQKVGSTVVLNEVIPEFTLNCLCETALGVKLDNIAGSREYRETIHNIEICIVKRVCNPLMYIEPFYYLFGDYRAMQKHLKIANHFSSKIIEKKRKERKNGSESEHFDEFGKKKRYALLDTLLDAEQQGLIAHKDICDEVNTFMFEGYDTTSVCLIFTLMNIALRQDIQNKCYNEIQDIDDLGELTVFDFNKLEYIECVIKETLRLYPSVPFIGRQCMEETTLNGLILPANTQINVHIIDIMRDPKHFSKPTMFDPDRFLPKYSVKRNPFAFIPFSAGPRNCIGQKFAIFELKAMLVSIIKKFKLLPVTRLEDIVFENGLVLHSQKPIEIKLINR